jgi:hypothetical protein
MYIKYANTKKSSKKKAIKSKMASKITKKKKPVTKKKKRTSKAKPKKNNSNVIRDASLNQHYYVGGYILIFGVFALAIYYSQ